VKKEEEEKKNCKKERKQTLYHLFLFFLETFS